MEKRKAKKCQLVREKKNRGKGESTKSALSTERGISNEHDTFLPRKSFLSSPHPIRRGLRSPSSFTSSTSLILNTSTSFIPCPLRFTHPRRAWVRSRLQQRLTYRKGNAGCRCEQITCSRGDNTDRGVLPDTKHFHSDGCEESVDERYAITRLTINKYIIFSWIPSCLRFLSFILYIFPPNPDGVTKRICLKRIQSDAGSQKKKWQAQHSNAPILFAVRNDVTIIITGQRLPSPFCYTRYTEKYVHWYGGI